MKCILSQQVCDNSTHCDDGSDESLCKDWTCIENWEKCNNGLQCIQEDKFCDGKTHCFDFSDEDATSCSAFVCFAGYTKCADELQCINDTQICDGHLHCNDASDELCESQCLKTPLQPHEKYIIKKCQEDSSVCFPITQYCDGMADCPEGSDEAESGCTCEDWGLIAQQEDDVSMCLYPEWTTMEMVNQTVQPSFISMNQTQSNHTTNVQANDTGLYINSLP